MTRVTWWCESCYTVSKGLVSFSVAKEASQTLTMLTASAAASFWSPMKINGKPCNPTSFYQLRSSYPKLMWVLWMEILNHHNISHMKFQYFDPRELMFLLHTDFISILASHLPMARRSSAEAAENLEAEECQLPAGSLAAMLEGDVRVRNRLRFREEGKLMRWLKNAKGQEIVGQCTMTTIAMNTRVLAILARFWCPKSKKIAKSPSIHLIRKEARFEMFWPIHLWNLVVLDSPMKNC